MNKMKLTKYVKLCPFQSIVSIKKTDKFFMDLSWTYWAQNSYWKTIIINIPLNSPTGQPLTSIRTSGLTSQLLSLTTVKGWILAGACEKVASDLGLGSSFWRELQFPPSLTTGYSWFSLNMAEKVMIIEIQPTSNQWYKVLSHNHSNAGATFVQSTRMQRFLKQS